MVLLLDIVLVMFSILPNADVPLQRVGDCRLRMATAGDRDNTNIVS